MKKDTVVNIRISSELKKEASKIFDELGFNLSSGIELFLREVIKNNGFPFEVASEKHSVTLNKRKSGSPSNYNITYRVEGYFEVEVEANNIDEAQEKADISMNEADFGALKDSTAETIGIIKTK